MVTFLLYNVLALRYSPGSGFWCTLSLGILASLPKMVVGMVAFGSNGVWDPGPGMAGCVNFLSITRSPFPKRTIGDSFIVSFREGMPYFPGPGAASSIFRSGLPPPKENDGAERHVDICVILTP